MHSPAALSSGQYLGLDPEQRIVGELGNVTFMIEALMLLTVYDIEMKTVEWNVIVFALIVTTH
jgi:hypothetical protein